VVGQSRDVRLALAERRDLDGDDVEPVVEVLAELALGDQPFDLMTAMGFLILIGVVVNNAILVVDGALARLRDGIPLAPAVSGAVEGRVRPIYFYSVDMSEFATKKLADRGSLTARSILTNVQDFIVTLARGLMSRCPR